MNWVVCISFFLQIHRFCWNYYGIEKNCWYLQYLWYNYCRCNPSGTILEKHKRCGQPVGPQWHAMGDMCAFPARGNFGPGVHIMLSTHLGPGLLSQIHVKNPGLLTRILHEDVMKWNYFPRYWSFVRGIHRSRVNSPHKGQWHGAFMVYLICAWINGWVNNGEAGDLRRHRAHYVVTVMITGLLIAWQRLLGSNSSGSQKPCWEILVC